MKTITVGLMKYICYRSIWAGMALIMSPALAQEVVLPGAVEFSEDFTIEAPLTTGIPDPFRGLEVFIDRKLGNCVACHTNNDVAAMQFLGQIGPVLDWVGDRMTEGEIRAVLVDPKIVLNPDTLMPAFYTDRTGSRVMADFQGKTILTAQQIEDVVAYMSSLSQETGFDGVD